MRRRVLQFTAVAGLLLPACLQAQQPAFRPVIRFGDTVAAKPAPSATKPETVKQTTPAPAHAQARPPRLPAKTPAESVVRSDVAVRTDTLIVEKVVTRVDTVVVVKTVERPSAPVASAAKPPKPKKPAPAPIPRTQLVLRGFVGATAFVETSAFGFGNGQNALWSKLPSSRQDQDIIGADIRNTRITLALGGGEVTPGWGGNGTIEFDFFGGFPGASAASDEQPLPRLRLAYADLTHSRTTIRVGQFWSPLAGNVPVSASRIAYPLGLGSGGLIGWRNPGMLLQQNLTAPERKTRITAQVAALRGSWSGPGDVLDQQSAGETSAVPQLEFRLDVGRGTRWSAYAIAHYDSKDLSGLGPDTAQLGNLTGKAASVGARVNVNRVTVHGNAYFGRAIGQQMGQFGYFGDISSRGGWLQAGYNFTPFISAWGYYGLEHMNRAQALQVLRGDIRYHNALSSLLLQYTRGDYGAGVEWIAARTTWANATLADRVSSAHQVAFSVVYRFSSETPRGK